MAKVKIQGNASGTGVLTVTAPNTSTDRTVTLPDATGTLLMTDGSGASLTGVGGDLSFGGDTFGANKTIGSNDNYALSFETNATERLQLTNDGRGLSQFTAKAWCNFNGTVAAASMIRDSHNVSSITDNGTGDYTVNFSNSMTNANYSFSFSGGRGTSNDEVWFMVRTDSVATSSIRLGSIQGAYARVDCSHLALQIFGD